MLEEIRKLVETACKQPTNYFGYGSWTHHILPAVGYAKLMAKKTGADEEIIEIAALFHDYASVKDYGLYENHHIDSAGLAAGILKKFSYPENKIEQVRQCILGHRGSKAGRRATKEAQCVADGDAMVHFDSIPSLFYLAFFSHRMGIDGANSWLMQKLERSWSKLSPGAKEIVKDKHEASKLLLGGKFL